MEFLKTKLLTSEFDYIPLDSTEKRVNGLNENYIIYIKEINGNFQVIESYNSLNKNNKKLKNWNTTKLMFDDFTQAEKYLDARYEFVKKTMTGI